DEHGDDTHSHLDGELAEPVEVEDVVDRHRDGDRAGHGEDLPLVGDARTEDRDRHRKPRKHGDAAEARRRAGMEVAIVVGFCPRSRQSRQPHGRGHRGDAHRARNQERWDGAQPGRRDGSGSDHPVDTPRYGSGKRRHSARLRSLTSARTAGSSKPPSMLATRPAISSISGSPIPREVTDGEPSRIPLGLYGVPPWPGKALALTVTRTSSKAA